MKDKINEALKQFNREDLIDDGYERDLDSNIEVFLTIKQMIYYSQLQSNWNSLRELIEQYLENEKYSYMSDNPKDRCRYDIFMEIKDKMNELEGKDNNE